MDAEGILAKARQDLDGVCIADGFDNFVDKFASAAEAVLALRGRVKGTTDFINRLAIDTLKKVDNFSG